MTEYDNTIVVTDDDGVESEMRILLTFHSEDFGKDYVLFFRDENEEEIFAGSYDEEGNLFVVEESSEEWEMINEVFEAYLSEETKDEEKEE